MDKKLQHFGIPGMHWGVRRNRTSGGRKFVPMSGKDGRTVNKLFGKRNRTKIKESVDKALGESIGLKKISQLKSKEVSVTWERGRYISTVALATIGAWKVGEWLGSM